MEEIPYDEMTDLIAITVETFTAHRSYEISHEFRHFAVSNKFCFAAFNILMPYPSTPLYKKLKDENRLLYNGKWWLHPAYRFNHAAFVPKNMTSAELTEAAFNPHFSPDNY